MPIQMETPALAPGVEDIIEHFLTEKLRKTGAKGYVIGLSGGVDSAVVLRLAVRAVGRENVLALMMPDNESPGQDLLDAKELCDIEGVSNTTIDITGVVAAFSEALGKKVDRQDLANIKARVRMAFLYCHARQDERLVLGTSNKSELLIGYFTKYGDGGADLEPIGDLYKTQVCRLAERIKIPKTIRDKQPSAGLWKGQTDEKDIGMPYDRLDLILKGIELALDEGIIEKDTGISVDDVRRITEMVRLSSHKRKFPAVVKIGFRTPGLDWRDGDEDI
ncbi:MAG: NAD+ synthase [Methanobacteriota archaeon]|nr:MAG: NAD+ synthase [Euryarchaeota archaeon]